MNFATLLMSEKKHATKIHRIKLVMNNITNKINNVQHMYAF